MPKSITSTARERPGQITVRTPNRIAATPRSAIAHQFLARVATFTSTIPIMSCLPSMPDRGLPTRDLPREPTPRPLLRPLAGQLVQHDSRRAGRVEPPPGGLAPLSPDTLEVRATHNPLQPLHGPHR